MRHSDVKNKIISHCWKKFEGNSTIVEITLSRWEHFKQECIPVGCVPAAHWPYAAVYFPGGVCLVWGGLLLRGGLPGPGGCLPGLGGSPWSAGVSAWLVRGVSCSRRGLPGWSGGGVSHHALRQTPPMDRILDTRLWKYYLGPTSLRPVTSKDHAFTF